MTLSVLADTGDTGQYFDENTEKICQTYRKQRQDLQGNDDFSLKTTILSAPQLSEYAKKLIFKKITSGLLMLIGKLCDDNCVVLFSKKKLHILKNNQLIMEGQRNSRNKLWNFPLKKQPT